MKKKIGNFKQHLCANPPIIWEDFFKQVLDQVQPLTRKTQWELFLLSDDKNLVQLIAKDSVLQKLLLKAEGRHVAIDKKHVEKVRKRLASLGYLM